VTECGGNERLKEAEALVNGSNFGELCLGFSIVFTALGSPAGTTARPFGPTLRTPCTSSFAFRDSLFAG